MKKTLLVLEFILIFLVLLLPPVFVKSSGGIISAADFSLRPALVEALIALVLLLQNRLLARGEKSREEHGAAAEAGSDGESPGAGRFRRMVSFMRWTPLTLGILLIQYAVLEALYVFFPGIMPDAMELSAAGGSPAAWARLMVTFLCASFFEEVLYREYLPGSLMFFFNAGVASGRKKAVLRLVLELAGIVIFALAHRYLGALGVINALISAVVLRTCYLRTGSVFAGWTAHFLYNASVMVFASLVSPA